MTTLTLDLNKSRQSHEWHHVRIGDKATSDIFAEVYQDGQPFSLHGYSARFCGVDSQGFEIEDDNCSVAGNKIAHTLAQKSAQSAGEYKLAYFSIHQGEERINSTQTFNLKVLPSAESDSREPAGPYISRIDNLVTAVKDALDGFANMETTWSELEASAIAATNAANQAAAAAAIYDISANILKGTAHGSTIALEDAYPSPLLEIRLDGACEQDGVPTADTPAPIEAVRRATLSAGNSQKVPFNILQRNLMRMDTFTASAWSTANGDRIVFPEDRSASVSCAQFLITPEQLYTCFTGGYKASGIQILFWDSDGIYLTGQQVNVDVGFRGIWQTSFTAPIDAASAAVNIRQTSGAYITPEEIQDARFVAGLEYEQFLCSVPSGERDFSVYPKRGNEPYGETTKNLMRVVLDGVASGSIQAKRVSGLWCHVVNLPAPAPSTLFIQPERLICDRFVSAMGTSIGAIRAENANTVLICPWDQSMSVISAFNAWLAANPTTIIYPLAEPYTTPAQAVAMPILPATDSTVTCVGTPQTEVSITYMRDITLAWEKDIQELKAAIETVG